MFISLFYHHFTTIDNINTTLLRLTVQPNTLQGIPVLILDGEYRADSRVTSVDRQIECTCHIGVEHIRFKRTYIAQACDKHTSWHISLTFTSILLVIVQGIHMTIRCYNVIGTDKVIATIL